MLSVYLNSQSKRSAFNSKFRCKTPHTQFAAKHHIHNPLQTTTYEKRALTLLVSAPAVYPCQLLLQADCQTHSEWRNNTPPTSNRWESTHYCSFSNYSFSIAITREYQDFSFSPQISTFKTYIQNYSMIFAPINKILTAGL